MVLKDCSSLVVAGQASREKEELLKATSFPRAWHVGEPVMTRVCGQPA